MTIFYVVARIRKDGPPAICFSKSAPFIGTENDAKALMLKLSKENPGETYEVFSLRSDNAVKSKKPKDVRGNLPTLPR